MHCKTMPVSIRFIYQSMLLVNDYIISWAAPGILVTAWFPIQTLLYIARILRGL